MKALHKYTFYVSKTSPKEWLVRRLVTTRRTDEKWIPVHLEHVGIEPFDVARILRKLVENKDLREAIGDDGILGQVRLGGRLIPAIRVAVDLDRAVQVAEMLCRLLFGANSTSSRIYFSDEDQAMPILDVIHEVIPYCFNYDYDTLYVRKEEKALIVDKMKAIRCVVSRDPTDPALGEVGRSLLRTSFAIPESHNGETGKDCLVRRKKDIVALYDLFIWWMEEVCHEGFFAAGP